MTDEQRQTDEQPRINKQPRINEQRQRLSELQDGELDPLSASRLLDAWRGMRACGQLGSAIT